MEITRVLPPDYNIVIDEILYQRLLNTLFRGQYSKEHIHIHTSYNHYSNVTSYYPQYIQSTLVQSQEDHLLHLICNEPDKLCDQKHDSLFTRTSYTYCTCLV